MAKEQTHFMKKIALVLGIFFSIMLVYAMYLYHTEGTQGVEDLPGGMVIDLMFHIFGYGSLVFAGLVFFISLYSLFFQWTWPRVLLLFWGGVGLLTASCGSLSSYIVVDPTYSHIGGFLGKKIAVSFYSFCKSRLLMNGAFIGLSIFSLLFILTPSPFINLFERPKKPVSRVKRRKAPVRQKAKKSVGKKIESFHIDQETLASMSESETPRLVKRPQTPSIPSSFELELENEEDFSTVQQEVIVKENPPSSTAVKPSVIVEERNIDVKVPTIETPVQVNESLEEEEASKVSSKKEEFDTVSLHEYEQLFQKEYRENEKRKKVTRQEEVLRLDEDGKAIIDRDPSVLEELKKLGRTTPRRTGGLELDEDGRAIIVRDNKVKAERDRLGRKNTVPQRSEPKFDEKGRPVIVRDPKIVEELKALRRPLNEQN